MKLAELARLSGLELEGDPALEVTAIRGLENAGPSHLSFVADVKAAKQAVGLPVRALVASPALELPGKSLLRAADPRLAMVALTQILHPQPLPVAGVHPRAFVGEGCQIDSTASIGPLAVLEAGVRVGAQTVVMGGAFVGRDAVVGAHCLIHPNVTIGWGCRVGDRVIVHAGTVLGSDGFGYLQREGRHVKIPHVGNVVIEDDVELGGNNTIDRAVYDSTVIGRGTKTDNAIHIAHNVRVGQNSLLLGQIGIAGSTKTGKNLIMAGQSGLLDHLTIPDNVTLGPKSVITKAVPADSVVYGYPAIPVMEWQRQVAQLKNLGRLASRVSSLWKRYGEEEEEK